MPSDRDKRTVLLLTTLRAERARAENQLALSQAARDRYVHSVEAPDTDMYHAAMTTFHYWSGYLSCIDLSLDIMTGQSEYILDQLYQMLVK